MKTTFKILVSCLIVLASQMVSAQSDTDAIKAVIEKETTSYFSVNQQNWETTWLDAPYTYWTYSDSTGGSFMEGTSNIRKNYEEYFRVAKPSKSKITREWQEIRIYGKSAYVRFIQRATDEIDVEESSELRFLEKDKDGKWKIICLSTIARYPNR